MRKIIFIIVCTLVASIELSFAQTSFSVGEDVAVFYPADFDSVQTLPSVIFKDKLVPVGPVPSDWKVFPKFSKDNNHSIVRISYEGKVDLYGTGEVVGPLRRNEMKITLWNTDNYMYAKDNGKRLYQSHPWVMGVREDGSAFGIIADNTWKQELDLSNPVTFTSEGPAFRVVVIEKKSPEELLKALGQLTGTMELPPLWALGYQQSRYSYYPQSRAQEVAGEFRKRHIPCDVLWLDINYMQDFKIFTFDSIAFPQPEKLNDYLHSIDFHSVWMIDPGVKKEKGYFVYDEGTNGNYWVQDSTGNAFVGSVWPGSCSFPDFTMPAVCKWWGGLYKNFMALGVDGVWNDMNEPSVFDGPDGTTPENNRHRGGGNLPAGSHLRYHNIFGMLMVKASREGILNANPDKRPFVLSRSNFLGGQRYAATWTGDNNSTRHDFKMATPMVLTMGLSGQPFCGPDLGGYKGSPDSILFADWIAVGAFYPFCRNHTETGEANQEPWVFGKKVEDVTRTALNRRYRLMPYLYTLFQEASVSGLPVMRPVFFADPTDLSLRGEEKSFLLGNDLLIIPHWATDSKLPSGDWKTLKLEDSDDGFQPTVKLRSGAIVPMGKIIQSTVDYKTDSITLLINPKADGTAFGTLYDDAGESFEYKNGDFDMEQFVATTYGNDSIKVEITQTAGQRNSNRVFRAGLVREDEIKYSDWSDSTVLYVPVDQE